MTTASRFEREGLLRIALGYLALVALLAALGFFVIWLTDNGELQSTCTGVDPYSGRALVCDVNQ